MPLHSQFVVLIDLRRLIATAFIRRFVTEFSWFVYSSLTRVSSAFAIFPCYR
jgi:hypothetical protein